MKKYFNVFVNAISLECRWWCYAWNKPFWFGVKLKWCLPLILISLTEIALGLLCLVVIILRLFQISPQ